MKKILIVENHSDIQYLLKTFILNHLKAQIIVSTNEEAAIDELTNSEPDLVILSHLSLEDDSGSMNIRTFLKQSRSKIPFVIFTCLRSPLAVTSPDELFGKVVKMDFNELISTIKKLGFE